MSTLQGAAQLKARIAATNRVFKPVLTEWRDRAIADMRPQVPVRTGKTRRSIHRGRVTLKKASVVGSYVNYFLSTGTKAHVIAPKRASVLAFERGGRTVFARKVNHPQTRGRRYRESAANEAYRETDVLGRYVKLWNDAA